MTEYDPPLGSLPDQDHDHDVLLVAGSRPEVARLAPVATAFNDVDRIRAVTVATGPDPMAVHEAFEALGVPADVTQLLREPFDPVNPASVGSMLMTRLDELLVDLDPSAIMVYGGGMTAAIAAQVAFWRQIPIVHLQAGVASDDLLCPFPQEANRRIIGQLASLFLTTGGAALGSPIGPNAIPVGDTMAPTPSPLTCGSPACSAGSGPAGRASCWSALDRLDSLGVLAGLPELLDGEPDIEVVLFGELGAHGAAAPIASHPRGTVVRNVPLADLVALLGRQRRARLRQPRAGQRRAGLRHARRARRRARHRRAGRLHPQHPQPARDGHRPPTARGAPAGRPSRPTGWRPSASSRPWRGCSASRPRPLLELPHPRLPEDDPAEAPTRRSGSRRVAPVLLSDGDLTKELANGRLVLEPWDPAMLQPSSIDVRLDRYFRVFQNSRYTHIDPREQQDELDYSGRAGRRRPLRAPSG